MGGGGGVEGKKNEGGRKDNNFKALASCFAEEDIFGASIFNLWASYAEGAHVQTDRQLESPTAWGALLLSTLHWALHIRRETQQARMNGVFHKWLTAGGANSNLL